MVVNLGGLQVWRALLVVLAEPLENDLGILAIVGFERAETGFAAEIVEKTEIGSVVVAVELVDAVDHDVGLRGIETEIGVVAETLEEDADQVASQGGIDLPEARTIAHYGLPVGLHVEVAEIVVGRRLEAELFGHLDRRGINGSRGGGGIQFVLRVHWDQKIEIFEGRNPSYLFYLYYKRWQSHF